MGEKKTDKRTIKTEKALCSSLAALLTTKELRRITVQEIADLADVNRVTFYKHYLDVYDLYDHLESDITTELGLLMLACQSDENKIKRIVEYIDENRTVFSMIFSPYSTGTLREKVYKMIVGTYLTLYREKYDIRKNDKEFEYVCYYHTAGWISVLEKWSHTGYEQSSDFVIETIQLMDNKFTRFCEERYKN